MGRPAVQRHPQGLSGCHNTPSMRRGGGRRRRRRGRRKEDGNGGRKVTEATLGGVEEKGRDEEGVGGVKKKQNKR